MRFALNVPQIQWCVSAVLSVEGEIWGPTDTSKQPVLNLSPN